MTVSGASEAEGVVVVEGPLADAGLCDGSGGASRSTFIQASLGASRRWGGSGQFILKGKCSTRKSKKPLAACPAGPRFARIRPQSLLFWHLHWLRRRNELFRVEAQLAERARHLSHPW